MDKIINIRYKPKLTDESTLSITCSLPEFITKYDPEYLDIRSNKLTSLPDNFNPPNLKAFYCYADLFNVNIIQTKKSLIEEILNYLLTLSEEDLKRLLIENPENSNLVLQNTCNKKHN